LERQVIVDDVTWEQCDGREVDDQAIAELFERGICIGVDGMGDLDVGGGGGGGEGEGAGARAWCDEGEGKCDIETVDPAGE
jgi:hypothetical protein